MKKLTSDELNRINISEFKLATKSPFIVVLDNIRSLNNIGSVFRSSDAFLVESIYLCGITAQPPHKDIHKTALGATESVDWKYFENTLTAIHELKQKGYKIISVEQAEKSILLQDFVIKEGEKYALILGHEVKGVAQEILNISDYVLEIPQFGTKHSFNVSVTTGIVLWDLFRKHRL